MVLKPEKEFLRQAFTNNSFGLLETDLSLRSVLDNSFSYLYRLQKNLIQYEEYFYSTRNQVYNIFKSPSEAVADSPEMGDFYLDDSGRVCVDFPVELVPSMKRKEFKNTQYHNIEDLVENVPDLCGKEITYEDLIEYDEYFYRIPVIIIDNQVLKSFKLKLYDDYFTAILPFDRYFLHSRNFDNKNNEYYYKRHDYTLQIINKVNPISKLKKKKEVGFFSITTNKEMLNIQSTSYDKPFGYISKGYINNLLNDYTNGEELKVYDKKEGCYFACIFHEGEYLGSTLIDVDVLEEDSVNGSTKKEFNGIQLNFDDNTLNNLTSTENFEIRFIFYRYLHKHTTTSGNKTFTSHEVKGESNKTRDNKALSDIFMIRKNEDEVDCFPEEYDMPVPSEDLMVFKIKKDDVTESGKKNWEIIPNSTVTPFYPNLYQIQNEKELIYVDNLTGFYYTEDGKHWNQYDEHLFTSDVSTEELAQIIENRNLEEKERYKLRNINPEDSVRIYYFYYPGYDLKYSHMYRFFYRYLYLKWGKGSDIGLNIEDIINGILFNTITLDDAFNVDPEKLKEMTTYREAVLELVDSSIEKGEVESTYNLFVGLSNELDTKNSILYLDESELTPEEKISKLIASFLNVFNFIVKHDIVEYRYDDIDYMKSMNKNIDDIDITYANSVTGLEYKIQKLKDFIADDPEALRKYVLCQNKTSIKYDFFATKNELDKRIAKVKKTIYRNKQTREYYDEKGNHFLSDNTPDEENNISVSELYEKYHNEKDASGRYIYEKEIIEVTDGFRKSIYRNKETQEYYDRNGKHFFSDGERDKDNDISIDDLLVLVNTEMNEEGDLLYQSEVIKIPMYLFMFERLNKANYLSCRIFIDGLLYTDYTQYAYDYQDLLYVPTYDIPLGSFVEIETFPTYYEKDIVRFTEENNSVIMTYHEDEFINPTIYDLLFRSTENPDEFYSKDDFKCEVILDDYNYYTDTENKIKVYSLLEKRNYYSGTLVDLSNEHKYVGTKKTIHIDNGDGTFTDTEVLGYNHYDSSGTFIEFLRSNEIPTGLSAQYFATEVYVNGNNGEYYAKDHSYQYFFHYDSNNNLLEDKMYTKEEVLEIARENSLTLEFDDIYVVNFGDGYYTRTGEHYTINGQRDRDYDVSVEVMNDWISNSRVEEYEVYPTGDLLEIIIDRNYINYAKVFNGETTVNHENTNMVCSPIKRIQITCLNPDLFDKDIEISARKDSIFQVETMRYMNYPCIEIGITNQKLQIERYIHPVRKDYYEKETYYNKFYHYNSNGIKDEQNEDGTYVSYSRDEINQIIEEKGLIPYTDPGSNEYVRVFRSGRLCSKNRYELLLNDGSSPYGFPRVQMLEKIEQGETIAVDLTPYKNRLIYYKRQLDSDLVNLKGFINKPFDVRYYEVYLNGRRISRNNIFPISPYEIRLAGIHSMYNLEIYEKDRDWEYYGCDMNSYYTLSDLLNELFMEEELKKKIIDDTTGEVPENHICEDPIEWERDLDMETVFFEIFYYNRLLPLGLADADVSKFNFDDIKYNFPIVFKLFNRYDLIDVNNGEYEVVIDSTFKKVPDLFNQLLESYKYDKTAIAYYKTLNDLCMMIVKREGYGKTTYQLYTGEDIDSLTYKIDFSSDFVISGKNCVNFLYENGLWIITSYNSDIYYRSDGNDWYRDKFDFRYDSVDYTFYPYLPSYMNGKYIMFGEILVDSESPSFYSYGTIESENGMDWNFHGFLDSKYLNKGNMKYLSSHHVVYTSSSTVDWYTTDGDNFSIQSFSIIDNEIGIEGFKKTDFSVITPTIKEVCGIYYAGKESKTSTYFERAIYSTDGINWKLMNSSLFVTDIAYANKAWLLMTNNGSDQMYHMYKSLNGIDFEELDRSKTFSDSYLFSSPSGFYLVNKSNYSEEYLLFAGKKLTNDTHKEVNCVLLLDPDIYYDGDDNNRWNVYMTGNDDEFMDKYINQNK